MERVNIPWASPFISSKEKEYLQDAINSTWISGGAYVEKLERDFTRLLNSRYGIATSSGTSSLQLALLAYGIGSGDEVIVPGFSFAGAANMVLATGAAAVFVDIDSDTWCIDVDLIEERITSKTRAIIAVHTYGNVCDMDKLLQVADDHNLYLIEDAAEATLSKYKGRYSGTFGNIGCFSFQATKTITTGEGGFVVTNEKDLFDKMLLISNHGMKGDKRYWHEVIGYNFRLTNIQASIGCAQLQNLKKIITMRKNVYQQYQQLLNGEKGITLQRFLPEVEPVVWSVAVRIDPDIFGMDRDSVMNHLKKAGIETRPGFYPFSAMELYNAPRLSIAENLAEKVISLPMFCKLSTNEVEYISSQLKALRQKT